MYIHVSFHLYSIFHVLGERKKTGRRKSKSTERERRETERKRRKRENRKRAEKKGKGIKGTSETNGDRVRTIFIYFIMHFVLCTKIHLFLDKNKKKRKQEKKNGKSEKKLRKKRKEEKKKNDWKPNARSRKLSRILLAFLFLKNKGLNRRRKRV